MALVMPMAQLPTTRLGAAQVSSVACTPAGRRASMSDFSNAKSVADRASLPVLTRTRIRLAAGTPRAAT